LPVGVLIRPHVLRRSEGSEAQIGSTKKEKCWYKN
jgi:hypothetical protein